MAFMDFFFGKYHGRRMWAFWIMLFSLIAISAYHFQWASIMGIFNYRVLDTFLTPAKVLIFFDIVLIYWWKKNQI